MDDSTTKDPVTSDPSTPVSAESKMGTMTVIIPLDIKRAFEQECAENKVIPDTVVAELLAEAAVAMKELRENG